MGKYRRDCPVDNKVFQDARIKKYRMDHGSGSLTHFIFFDTVENEPRPTVLCRWLLTGGLLCLSSF